MFSFTSPELNASNNANTETVVEKVTAVNYEIILDNNYSDEFLRYSCTATITYNGYPMNTVTGYGDTPASACSMATTLATIYIRSMGGTYP